jgi:hypothetical protein
MSPLTLSRPPFSATDPHRALAVTYQALLCGARNHPESEDGYARAADTLRALSAYQRELVHLLEMGITREQLMSLLRQEAYAATCEADECRHEAHLQSAIDTDPSCPMCDGFDSTCFACNGKGNNE